MEALTDLAHVWIGVLVAEIISSAASLLIGLGMLGRAELAFVVMDIAYVQHQILSDEAFYTLMFTAFCLNVAVPVTIRWWKPYYERSLKLQEWERADAG